MKIKKTLELIYHTFCHSQRIDYEKHAVVCSCGYVMGILDDVNWNDFLSRDENREFLDVMNLQPNSSVIPMCSKCLIPAEYDDEECLYRCPKCKTEGCLVG